MKKVIAKNKFHYSALLLISIYGILLILGCTNSPLGEDIDSTTSTQLAGKVLLQDGESSEGVYVWLEGINVHTFADAAGQFQLELPPSNSGLANMTNGVFNLHFFVANYQLATATVIVKDGEFVRSRGDVNSSGELIGTKSLVKLLNIGTEVEPGGVNTDFEGVVHVSVSLQALHDSITVILPKLFSHFSDAVIIHNLSTDEAMVLMTEEHKPEFSTEKIGPDVRILQYDFYLRPGVVPAGKYEVVPFLLILQDKLPTGLLKSLGAHVEEISTDFLKIPFRREGGRFEVNARI
ncbi:MAG: hypothetical protein ACE5HI_16065 [bacterium]